MKIEDVYKEKINDLMIGRGCTKFHITGIRHCDFKDKADEFIEEAAKKMLSVSFFPEKANPYDHEAVSCRHGRKQIGYVTTYDLEKYYILACKDNADHLTGHFGRFSANIEDHLLKLYVPGSITLDDISDYRYKINKQKDKLYDSWNHDAIDQYLVHSRHQNEAIACISQLKENILMLYGAQGTSTRGELMPLLQDYKDCSHYDISLEGQQERWDILLYLDHLHDFNHQPGLTRDKFFEGILKDVEDVISQIGRELVRSVSYKAYIERLTELVTTDLPSSEAAQHYLKTLPSEAFEDIRQQVENFPHHLYRLFHTNPEEFVRALYYARIPRKYLDPFLSGIALVEAYDKKPKKWQVPNEETLELRNLGNQLEEWYEDYCERIVQYPIERQLIALRNMRKQVLASIHFVEGSPRMGDGPEEIQYVKFIGPKRDFPARLRDFGPNFVERVREGDIAWEEYVPEKIAHEMTFVEFAYIFFIGALKYEIDRLENIKSYNDTNEGDNNINAVAQQKTEDNENQLPIPKAINTKRAQEYFQKAIEKGYMRVENELFIWIGVKQRRNGTPNMSELAYFLGKVYEYKYSNNGNIGKSFPDKELGKLFNITKLYTRLNQVYQANNIQSWRQPIDDMFQD